MVTIDINKNNRQLNRRLGQFSGHFMSDSKWTKVFEALSQNCDIIKKCLIKDVLDNKLRQLDIPPFEKFTTSFYDKGINDVMSGGPSLFKEIEWVEFPAHWVQARSMRTETLQPFNFHQDIMKIKELLDNVGELVTDFDKDKLIIYGYR